MAGFEHAPPEVLAFRERLATEVERCLTDTGIPISRAGAEGGNAGIEIDVDTGDDTAGGVFVRWHPHRDRSTSSGVALLAGEFDSPAIKRLSLITSTCMLAVRELLYASGFALVDAETTSDYRTGDVAILSGPKSSRTNPST